MFQFNGDALGPPVNVQVLVPVFAKVPKPWYWVPTSAMLNVLFVAPPSANVSAVLKATTFPMMVDPACNVRLFVPPVKVIALARVVPSPDRPPAIVPLFVIVRPAPEMPTPPAPALPAAPFVPPALKPPAPPAPPLPP